MEMFGSMLTKEWWFTEEQFYEELGNKIGKEKDLFYDAK
jgi:hypothetical protein